MKKRSEPISILFILPHLDLGGGARRIKVYCDYLDRKKFFPVVAVTSNQVIRDIDTVIGKQTARIVSEDNQEILRFAKKHKVKVVYTWYDGQFHQSLFELLSELKNQSARILANNVFSYFDQHMDAVCDRVIFQTYMMLEIKFKSNFPISKKFNYHKYRQLYNPVNSEYFEQFRLSAMERRKLRSQYGFSEQDVIVGRFGRNDIVKFGDQLFWAVIKLRNQPHIKFFITGMPRSRRYILKALRLILPHLNKNCLILSPTADDQELMERMQIVDIVSHSVRIGEGCSNAINEAMFWGKPVITNSTPHCDNGQVEQVDDGRTGIVVSSTHAFIQAIQNLANNKKLRSTLGKASATKVASKYEAKFVINQFTELLDEVLKKNLIKERKAESDNTKTCQTYQKWYTQFIIAHQPKIPNKYSLDWCMNFVVRIFNFIEYKYFNG